MKSVMSWLPCRGASGVVYRVLLNGVHPLAAKAIELGASEGAQRAFVKVRVMTGPSAAFIAP